MSLRESPRAHTSLKDVERLEVLARIALRLSTLPDFKSPVRLLPRLLRRVDALDHTVSSGDKVSDLTVEYLFRSSLVLEPAQMMPHVREAVMEISRRVGQLSGTTGEWVRTEQRRVEWEAIRS